MSKTIIHHLIPDKWAIPDLRTSPIASLRLRVAIIPAAYGGSGDISFTYGSEIPKAASVVIACKPLISGAKEGEVWLDRLRYCSLLGVPIVIDYTDHHLILNTPYSHLYREALPLADKIVVASKNMGEELEGLGYGNTCLLEDAIDLDTLKPRLTNPDNEPTVMWFGHPTNVTFLTDYINRCPHLFSGIRLLVLTNDHGAELFRDQANPRGIKMECHLIPWSKDTMIQAARISNWGLIPSDPRDMWKRHVSANRLLTSLALGLPTVASPVRSYLEFDGCFTNISKVESPEFWRETTAKVKQVQKAQAEFLPKYSSENLGKKWKKLLENVIHRQVQQG